MALDDSGLSMRAVYFEKHGGVDVLQHGDLPRPKAGPGEVLVRVRACALNHLDLWVRRGWPALKLAMPHIPGSDISGIVHAAGPGVEGCAVGDEIVVSPGLSCGCCEHCLSGLDNNCEHYRVIGEHTAGGYAEFVAVPATNIVAKPANLSFVQAAAFPLTFLTSWHMLVAQAKIQPGEWLLVLAAGSGVGVAALQIGRLFGARLIAAAGSPEKLEKAAGLGARHLINYETQDFAAEVQKITGGRGVDVVFEHVGEKTWARSIKSLVNGGRLVTCGATTGFNASTDLRHLFYRNLKIYGNLMGSKAELVRIGRHFADGDLLPVVDRVLPLAQAREGHRALEKRSQFGKVVLSVGE